MMVVHLVTIIRETFMEEEIFELNIVWYRIWIVRFRDKGENSSNFDNLDALEHSQTMSLVLDESG